MAKVQQKTEKYTAFVRIFFALDKIDSILSTVIDSQLELRSTLIGISTARLVKVLCPHKWRQGTSCSYLHPSKSASGKRSGLKRGSFVPLRRCSLKS